MYTIDDLTIDPETLAYSHPSWGDVELNRHGANQVLDRANDQDWALTSPEIAKMARLLGREKGNPRKRWPRLEPVCCEDPSPRTTHAGEHYETSCVNCGELIDED